MIGVGDLSGSAARPALIQRLLADVDLSVITSVDLGDPQLQDDVDQFRRNFDDPILLGGMCNGLAQMVLAVQSRARPGRVAALRLDGHEISASGLPCRLVMSLICAKATGPRGRNMPRSRWRFTVISARRISTRSTA